MKKLVVVFSLLAAFITPSTAKIQAGIGIKVGPAMGRYNNEFFSKKQSNAGGTLGFQTGVHAGLQGRIWFNKFIGINLGAEFNMNGNVYTRIAGPNGEVTITNTHKENQITVPLSAMVGWGNERLRFFANLGGYFGYNISGKDITKIDNNGSQVPTTSEKSDYKDNFNNIDAGIRMGAGFQVYVDKKLRSCVTFDINYDLGFLKVYRNGVPASFVNNEDLNLRPSKLTIGVGYMYSFGKSQSEEAPKRVVIEQ